MSKLISIMQTASDELSEIIYNNQGEFFDKFTRGYPEELLLVSYNEHGIVFTYLNEYGASIKDDTSWEDFQQWLIDYDILGGD